MSSSPTSTESTLPASSPSSGAVAVDEVPERTALSLAKVRLIEAAQLIDPLKPIREHPFVTVSVAGGAGAVLGSTGGAAVAFSSLIHSFAAVLRSMTALAGPLATMLGPIIAGKFAGEAAEHAAADAPPPSPTPA